MTDSTNLAFPYLKGAQAQKHVTVNESLRKLDALVLLAIEDKDLTAPPGSPADGARYIPKATATGAWSGKEKYVAHYVDGAWEFYAPREGFTAYVRDEDLIYVYNGTAWVTLENALDADLKAIAQLSPSNDDVVQRKSGAWTNRTMAQLTADLMANGQLPFPATQNPSSNANTLDDYEEGTFTPTITSSGGGAPTYSVQVGFYTKIGNRVCFDVRVVLATLGTLAAGVASIAGLPFTADATTNHIVAQAFNANNMGATATTMTNSNINASGTAIALNVFSAGANTSLTIAMLTGTSVFNVAGQYAV